MGGLEGVWGGCLFGTCQSLRPGTLMGSPPHIKGWINPDDWEGGGGVLRLGIGRGFLSPHLTAYLSGTEGPG